MLNQYMVLQHSMADDDAVIDDALTRFQRVFKNIDRPTQDAKF